MVDIVVEIVHKDLKPANFLLIAGTLKLIDFGISRIVPKNLTSIYTENPTGTLNFIAPEVINNVSEASGGFKFKVSTVTRHMA